MSLVNEVLAGSRLKKGNKSAESAKAASGEKADQLFDKACKSYSAIVENSAAMHKALYHWGTALYDHGLLKTGEAATDLYRSACEKFSAAWVVDPSNPRIANDWGVAYMQLARVLGVSASDELYNQAQEKFQLAENLQAGLAAYNLACLCCLRGEYEACQEHLEKALACGRLPDMDEVKEDPDLGNVQPMAWFQEFVMGKSEPAEEK